MGAAMELISGFVTAPSATATAITNNNGTSNTIRNFTTGRAFIIAAWKTCQGLGYVQYYTPRMHDASNGIITQLPDSAVGARGSMLFPIGQPQEVFSQDTLTIKTTGSATAGDIEQVNLLAYYETYTDGKFIKVAELNNRRANILAIRNSFTATTDGTFTAGTAVSSFTSGDILKANTDYAVLGLTFSESDVTNLGASALTFQGPDTGNLPVGIPLISPWCENWFLALSKAYDAPMIPVFNSANKGGTLFKVSNDENANTVIVSVLLAELS